MGFNGWGKQNLRAKPREKSVWVHLCQLKCRVNVNALACFVHSKNASVDEILSVAQDCKGQGAHLQITDQL